MIPHLTPIGQCKELAGLAPHEIVLGVSPSEKHERLLAKYRRARRSQTVARAKIVADIRAAVSTGAKREAADLLIVLRRLLALGPGQKPDPGAAPPSPRRSASPRRRAGWRPMGARTCDLPQSEGGQVVVFESPVIRKRLGDPVV